MKAPSGLGNRISRKHYFGSQKFGHDYLVVGKLNIPLDYSDEFRIDSLWFVEKIRFYTKEKGLLEFETNLLKFLDIEEMVNVYRRLILSTNGGYLYN